MPSLNILTLNQGDTQEDIRNKINANFDSLVVNGGGPQGLQGAQGKQGPVGPAGPKGDPGQQGVRGTKWFVQENAPTGGTGDPILVGDYWLDSTSGDNLIYEFGPSGWFQVGDALINQEIFYTLTGVSGPNGSTAQNAILLNSSIPELQTLVISDAVLDPPTANPTYSKVLIATNSATNDAPLLEFAKTNANDIGLPADYTRHPQFRWMTSSSSDYNLLFTVPQDSLTLSSDFLNLQSSGVASIYSYDDLSISSSASTQLISSNSVSINSTNLDIISQNLNVNSTASTIELTGRFSIESNTSTDFSAIITNQNPNGNGISVTVGNSTSSQTVAEFGTNNLSVFKARSDGKVTLSKFGNAVREITYNSDRFSSPENYWEISSSTIPTGNTIYFNPSVAYSANLGFQFQGGTGATGSWVDFLEENESIEFRFICVPGIQYLVRINGSTPGTKVDFTSSNTIKNFQVTIIRLSAVTKMYYTANGVSGEIT